MTKTWVAGLASCEANYVPLTPLSFMRRSAQVFPQHTAVVYGDRRLTWSEAYGRSRRLASALARRGLGPGDTVSALLFNTPEMLDLHFGVPMSGALLHTINTRLDAPAIRFVLQHAESKVLIADSALHEIVHEALAGMTQPPLVVDVCDPQAQAGQPLGDLSYEALLDEGDPGFQWKSPSHELAPITVNYTSGTTGDPKGVVYSHRGAYLLAVNNILAWELPKHPVYLWTLPMFHCNGWCFPWTIAAVAGTNVCLRNVDVDRVYDLIEQESVTHYCGAPIVHNMLANADDSVRARKQRTVKGMVAAAPPPASVLKSMDRAGFDITHVYGLTECYGPAVVCEWQREWDRLPMDEQAALKARQGVAYHMLEDLIVADPETMRPVPADGRTLGEVMMRGNIVMLGYLKSPESTEDVFRGGWLHTGDLGVMHPDGYVELKDRSKDIVISGGENISTIEIEDVLYRHPAVLDAAVVAKPDDTWGETPCAFVTLREHAGNVTAEEIIKFCRDNMAHFKAPRHVVFGPLPKTSTGKTQKFVLRERAKGI